MVIQFMTSGGNLEPERDSRRGKSFREHLKSGQELVQCVRAFRIELEFGSVGLCGEGKTGVPPEKPPGARRDQQQTQPTYDAGTGNRTRATFVGGECSHHCATPDPRSWFNLVNKS